MLTHSIQTFDDAYALLQHYDLLSTDWGRGSASGFVARLLTERPRALGARWLATMLTDYKQRCMEDRSDAGSATAIDAELVRQATAIEALEAIRRQMRGFVRRAKYGHVAGPWAWKLVAELATMRPTKRLDVHLHLQPEFLTHAAAILHGLAAFAAEDASDHFTGYYSPGSELLDSFVRIDIERLDEPATSESWPHGGLAEDCAIGALFALARDAALLASVAVLRASTTSKAGARLLQADFVARTSRRRRRTRKTIRRRCKNMGATCRPKRSTPPS